MWSCETSTEIDADAALVWALFADVGGWTAWNAGIERVELRGPFADGTQFVMTPPGTKPLLSTLLAVRPGEGFTDVTVVDGTTVTVHHRLAALEGGRTRVVFRAEVTGDAAATIGPMATGDFPEVLAGLKRAAEAGAPGR